MTHHRSHSDGADALSRALQMLSAYGADPRRWPPGERELFDALADDPQFAERRAEAEALDTLLADSPAEPAPDSLKRKILEEFSESVVKRRWMSEWTSFFSFAGGRFTPITAAVALSALGFVIGAAGARQDDALYYALDTSIISLTTGDVLWTDES